MCLSLTLFLSRAASAHKVHRRMHRIGDEHRGEEDLGRGTPVRQPRGWHHFRDGAKALYIIPKA